MGIQKLSRIDKFIKNPHRAVWQMAIPIMLGMSIQILYGIVDMAFVGRISGDAIAAITFNMPLVFLFIGLTFGLGAGVTSVVARFLGNNDKKSAENAAEHSILLGVFLGIVIPIISIVFARHIFGLLGAPAHIVPLAVKYFRIISLGFVFNILNIFFRSIMTGEGNTKTPMFFQAVGTGINIILDPILIFGLKLGIAGAALASIIGQFCVTLIFIYYIFIKKRLFLQFHFSFFQFSTSILKKILSVGVPASLSMIIMSFGAMLYNWLLVTFGSNAIAGYGVSRQLIQIYFLPMFAIGNSMVTLSGMFYGRGKVYLIRKTLLYAISRGEIISVVLGITFYFLSPVLLKIFTSNKEIISVGVQYIRYSVFVFPFITIGIISGRTFQGIGKGWPSLLTTSLRVVIVTIPLAYIFIKIMNLPIEYIWISQIISTIISAVVAGVWILITLRKLEVVSSQRQRDAEKD